MKKKCCMTSGYYKFMGFHTCIMGLITLAFYIVLMVRVFSNGTDWLTGVFLVLGLITILTILPAIANSFVSVGKRIEHHHCEDPDK